MWFGSGRLSESNIKTLFVDDSISASRIAQRAYGDVCDLDVVPDIPEAMERIASVQYGLIFVDYLLPSGSGIDLVRTIRGMEAFDHIPVILISSAITNQVAFGAMRAGVNVSISKTASISESRERVLGQLKSPHTEIVEPEILETCCLVWKVENVFYEYCPEIDKLVVAASEEGAHQQIEDSLKDEFRETRDIKLFADDIFLKRHIILLKDNLTHK